MNDASNESPTSEEGPRQIYAPRRELLIRFGGSADVAQHVVRFRITIPDSRIRCKFSVLANPREPDQNQAADVWALRDCTLWVYGVEQPDMGGRWVPVTNLDGSTRTAPLDLPTEPALGGYSLEAVTIADGIEGLITIPAQDGNETEGDVYLQARFQPDASAQIIPWSQWDEIRALCKIEVLQGPASVGAP